jgi:translation initiation factor 1
MAKNKRLVWSDDEGDLRKREVGNRDVAVHEAQILLKVRRLTSGKGRTVIEITGLPKNTPWCKALAKDIKKALGVGGTFKSDYIEIHGEKIEAVTQVLDKKALRWKQTGG